MIDEAGHDGRMTELVAGQAALGGKIATLTARVEAHMNETGAKCHRLFAFHDEDEKRVSAIERDYVSRDDFKRYEDKIEAKLDALVKSQDALKTQVTRIMAIGGVVIFAVNAAIGLVAVVVR